jgi:hypothetical protein
MKRSMWIILGGLISLALGVLAAPRLNEVFVANPATWPVPVSVVSHTPDRIFAGYTTATAGFASHPSVHDWHALCAEAFDGGRVATTRDWLDAVNPPLPEEEAWIFPVLVGGGSNDLGVDITGRTGVAYCFGEGVPMTTIFRRNSPAPGGIGTGLCRDQHPIACTVPSG